MTFKLFCLVASALIMGTEIIKGPDRVLAMAWLAFLASVASREWSLLSDTNEMRLTVLCGALFVAGLAIRLRQRESDRVATEQAAAANGSPHTGSQHISP